MLKRKPRTLVVRSYTARAAYERNGAGIHGDRRTKRQRTRSACKRLAIVDQGR